MNKRIFLINSLLVVAIFLFTGCQSKDIKTEQLDVTSTPTIQENNEKEQTENIPDENVPNDTEAAAIAVIGDNIPEELKTVIEDTNLNNDGYALFVAQLEVNNINSITEAVKKYKALAGEDKDLNDRRFRVFRTYFYNFIEKQNNLILNNESILNEPGQKTLKENGLRINFSESGEYLAKRPSFIFNEFGTYLSDSLREYEQIEMLEALEIGDEEHSTYLIEDAALFISWDELSDRIIRLEDYLKRYPNTSEKENALSKIDFYLWLYTASVFDNTPVFQGYNLNESVKKSYERFLSNYKNSDYYEIINGYYEVLKTNKFKLNDSVMEYLKSKDIDVSSLGYRINLMENN